MNLYELIRAAPELSLPETGNDERSMLTLLVPHGKAACPHLDAAALTRWMIPVLLPGLTAEHSMVAAAMERLTPAVTTLLRARVRCENNLKLLENV